MATKKRKCARDPKTGQYLKGTTPPKQQTERNAKVESRKLLDKMLRIKQLARDQNGKFAPSDGSGAAIGAFYLKTFLERVLRQFDPETGKFNAQVLAEVLFDMAVNDRNTEAMKEIFNRIDGRVVEKHEVENKVPVTLVFTPATPINQGPIINVEPKELPAPTENPFIEVVEKLNSGEEADRQ